MKQGPTIKRGKSKQDIETPWEFFRAAEQRFGGFKWDLAASKQNHKCPNYYDIEDNSLQQDWSKLKNISGQNILLWLNPPFDPVTPWVRKCSEEARKGAEILCLTRASIDANWYWEYVFPYADSYVLMPRLKFVGEANVYPGALMLNHYYKPNGLSNFELERWKWNV